MSSSAYDTIENSEDSRARDPADGWIRGRNGKGWLKPAKKGDAPANRGQAKPATYIQTLHLARKASPEAMRTLIRNLHHEDGRIGTMSASLILERAWGNAREMKPQEQERAHIDLSALSKEELDVLMKLALSGRLRAIDAAPVEEAPTIEAKPEGSS